MARYAFRCGDCGLEFEVARPMSEAARGAACPVDGVAATRIFTPPAIGSRGAGASAPGPAAAANAGGSTPAWTSPFFPRAASGAGPAAPPPAVPIRTFLKPGTSKPTTFRHFGHSHPVGTPAHTHRPRKTAP